MSAGMHGCRRSTHRVLATAALLALPALSAGCVMRRSAIAPPVITAVHPDSVNVPRGAVVELIVAGHGFAAGSPGMNTLEFAGMSIGNVPANASGTEIRFVVPDVRASGGEAAPAPLESGTYTLRVTTPLGTSNSMAIRIYR